MTPFEKYLRERREALQGPDASPEVWDNIMEAMSTKSTTSMRVSYRKWLTVAASVLLLVGAGWYWQSQPPLSTQVPTALLAYPDFEDQNFAELLDVQLAQIKASAVPAEYQDDLQQLLDQVAYLDTTYATQVKQLETRYSEDVAKQVLGYYQTKVALLTKIIREIDKINRYDNAKAKPSKRVPLKL